MVLTYHEIVENDWPYEYVTTQQRLGEHLRLLLELRARHSSLAAPWQITFDDGHVSHYCHGMPSLQAHNCGEAIFFITAGWMGTAPGHMNWEQVGEIAAAGYEIQSHGLSHKLLTQCSNAELKEELQTSRAMLSERLSRPVNAISLPGGAWDARTFPACAEAGYKRVYISDPWFGEQDRDGVRVVGRLMIRRTMSAAHLQKLLAAEGEAFSSVRLPHQFRQCLRKVLGDNLYHRLWCLIANDHMREELNRNYQDSAANESSAVNQ